MGVMVAMAGCCCALLVGLAAVLWRNVVRRRRARVPPLPFAEVLRQTRWRPRRAMARPPHPRMDLAAGVAVGSVMQEVRHDPRERTAAVLAEVPMPSDAARLKGAVRRKDFD